MRIRLAVIGAGLFVQDAHLPSLAALADDFEVVAIGARRLESAKRAASALSYPVEATDDIDALLARPDIDAVDIAVPMAATPELVRKALESGKHVFSEKPIALDPATARSLISLNQRAAGQIWMVGENWRIEPAFVRAAALIASGVIGTPRVAQWTNFASLNREDRYYTTEWRRSAANDAGLIVDGGVHHAAVLRLVLGEVDSVTATLALQRPDLPPYDTIAATLRFRSGAVGSYLVTYAYPAPWNSPLIIVADAGTLKVDTKSLELTSASGSVTETFSSAYFAVQDELRLFAEAVRTGRPGVNGPEEALADLLLVDAMMRAARHGAAVDVAR